MKKFMKVVSAILLAVIIMTLLGGFSYYFVITKDLSLSESNLGYKENTISIYNLNDSLINKSEYADAYIDIDEMPEHLKNAFISIEDKRFYRHRGIDAIRIAGAMVKNAKARKLKEGASTITQQLIKNTHLSSEKSLNRKIQEAKLAHDLEKKYNKQEILEMYLNVIYFGNGIYGVENASQRFFNKKCTSLTLSESAMLAGIVKNPSKYSPVRNYNNAILRRNLVLSLMAEQEMINDNNMNAAKNENISIKFKALANSELRPYIKNCIKQAADILGIKASDLTGKNYKIYTYLNSDVQYFLADKIYNSEYYKANDKGNLPDGMGIVVDNGTAGIIAYNSTSPYLAWDVRRQPGSAIKPLSVYAPALEYKIISPATQVLDELTDFNGYLPHNYNDNYYGWVSAREALAKSLNVPAVKIMSYLGTDRSLSFLENAGFNTNNEDSSLSLALGGTRNGATIIEMAAAYRALADMGNYRALSFIRRIEDSNGKVLFAHNLSSNKILTDDNAYLITDMLMSAVKSGTAGKLNYLDFDVASKTGTVSSSDSEYNSDAWSLSYTTEHTLCIWQGNISNTADFMLYKGITGGSYPTMLARDLYRDIYRSSNPIDFSRPESIISLELDKMALDKDHLLLKAGEFTPDDYKIREIFSENNQPKETSEYFISPKVENFKVFLSENLPNIVFNARKHVIYEIERNMLFTSEKIGTIEDTEGEIVFVDENAPPNSLIRYTVYPKIVIDNREIHGEQSNTFLIFTNR